MKNFIRGSIIAFVVMLLCGAVVQAEAGNGDKPSHRKISRTDVIYLEPMDIKAALVNKSGRELIRKYGSFTDGNFFYMKNGKPKTIGWLISEGVVLNDRHEYRTWKGNPKGTLIVYKNGNTEVGLKYDSDIAPAAEDIRFCCQGFNLFPLDLEKEGFDYSDVGYKTRRLAIGYNKSLNKIVIAIRPDSNAERAAATMKNLGCSGAAICLDSGSSANMVFEGKTINTTAKELSNILYW